MSRSSHDKSVRSQHRTRMVQPWLHVVEMDTDYRNGRQRLKRQAPQLTGSGDAVKHPKQLEIDTAGQETHGMPASASSEIQKTDSSRETNVGSMYTANMEETKTCPVRRNQSLVPAYAMFYICHTCSTQRVCSACATQCHRNHVLSLGSYREDVCDCGILRHPGPILLGTKQSQKKLKQRHATRITVSMINCLFTFHWNVDENIEGLQEKMTWQGHLTVASLLSFLRHSLGERLILPNVTPLLTQLRTGRLLRCSKIGSESAEIFCRHPWMNVVLFLIATSAQPYYWNQFDIGCGTILDPVVLRILSDSSTTLEMQCSPNNIKNGFFLSAKWPTAPRIILKGHMPSTDILERTIDDILCAKSKTTRDFNERYISRFSRFRQSLAAILTSVVYNAPPLKEESNLEEHPACNTDDTEGFDIYAELLGIATEHEPATETPAAIVCDQDNYSKLFDNFPMNPFRLCKFNVDSWLYENEDVTAVICTRAELLELGKFFAKEFHGQMLNAKSASMFFTLTANDSIEKISLSYRNIHAVVDVRRLEEEAKQQTKAYQSGKADILTDSVLQPLACFFLSPSVVKVTYGASKAVNLLEKNFGLHLVNVFDFLCAMEILELAPEAAMLSNLVCSFFGLECLEPTLDSFMQNSTSCMFYREEGCESKAEAWESFGDNQQILFYSSFIARILQEMGSFVWSMLIFQNTQEGGSGEEKESLTTSQENGLMVLRSDLWPEQKYCYAVGSRPSYKTATLDTAVIQSQLLTLNINVSAEVCDAPECIPPWYAFCKSCKKRGHFHIDCPQLGGLFGSHNKDEFGKVQSKYTK